MIALYDRSYFTIARSLIITLKKYIFKTKIHLRNHLLYRTERKGLNKPLKSLRLVRKFQNVQHICNWIPKERTEREE